MLPFAIWVVMLLVLETAIRLCYVQLRVASETYRKGHLVRYIERLGGLRKHRLGALRASWSVILHGGRGGPGVFRLPLRCDQRCRG